MANRTRATAPQNVSAASQATLDIAFPPGLANRLPSIRRPRPACTGARLAWRKHAPNAKVCGMPRVRQPGRAPKPASSNGSVGTSIPKLEAYEKVTGAALYLDDLRVPGVLHGRTVRSTVARGRIRQITFDPAFDWTGVVVVDHKDIPGE